MLPPYQSETYVVCLDCGRHFDCDWAHMRLLKQQSHHGATPPSVLSTTAGDSAIGAGFLRRNSLHNFDRVNHNPAATTTIHVSPIAASDHKSRRQVPTVANRPATP